MRSTITLISCAALLALSACGGKGDDKLAGEARQAADNRAEVIDASADNMTGTEKEYTQMQADAVRESGKAREDAIDDSDIDAHALSNGQKEAIVNGQ